MASPTSSSSSASAAPSSAPDPPAAAAAHPLPRPSFVSPPLRPPPLFSPQPLLGKPLNPPPPPPPQGFLYHHRGFPPRPASRPPPAAADQAVSVASPAGYIRNTTPTAVMTFAAVTQARPFVYGTSDQMVAQVHVPIHHVRPPPAPSAQQSATPLVVPRPTVAAAGPPQSIPVAALPKVTLLPSVSSTQENKNVKERDKIREDDIFMINDRKVRVLDGCTPSLYSLCRSWVRNGQSHEIQPVGSVEELSERDLLEIHIKHAKSVRARLRKERLRRIERCKQRLALLLPPPSELGRNETAP
ncbi:pollen-specific leucine-rich repeat extensin-like protein 1 isoform X2 [Musa acuminata AAA Group]|uniref:pollen-specific leucine-rich repeat extensin-like protein 1 isoform X2 n=1 Tax=Musa acuminata AAA Group TaxID=214697 RepID=UPI0031D7FD03